MKFCPYCVHFHLVCLKFIKEGIHKSELVIMSSMKVSTTNGYFT